MDFCGVDKWVQVKISLVLHLIPKVVYFSGATANDTEIGCRKAPEDIKITKSILGIFGLTRNPTRVRLGYGALRLTRAPKTTKRHKNSFKHLLLSEHFQTNNTGFERNNRECN